MVRTDDGSVNWRSAIDPERAISVFGEAGRALADIAGHLCESLAQAWTQGRPKDWIPPFNGARIAARSPFSAQSVDSELTRTLSLYSALHKLLAAARTSGTRDSRGLVRLVQGIVRARTDAGPLARRFSRQLLIGQQALPLRVDFLGQHYVCYMMRITQSPSAAEIAAERAIGRVQELHMIRRHVARQGDGMLGLFDGERPDHFEFLMVGDRQHPIQGPVMGRIDWAADRREVTVRAMDSPEAAARHIVDMERRAA